MIKNVVFDMGWVLVKFERIKLCQKYFSNDEDVKIVEKTLFGSIEWLKYDRGTINTEEIREIVKSKLDTRLHVGLDRLIDNWYNDMELISGTGEVIKKLKDKGYKIFILSNTNEKFHTFKHRLPGIEYVDGTFISCEHKLLKPDIEIFKTFAKVMNVNLDECFYTDDLLSNIEAATFMGMKGVVFESPYQLEQELIKLNLL
jgi:putative hydrolase of the HAD superfamily